MNRIDPYSLWVGHARNGRDFRALFDQEIKAVVDLALEEPATALPRELIALRFPLVDGPGNRAELLFLAVSTLATLLRLKVATLVTCGAGMSRAPAVSAAALALCHGLPPPQCLELVARHHAHDISPGLWQEVLAVLPSG